MGIEETGSPKCPGGTGRLGGAGTYANAWAERGPGGTGGGQPHHRFMLTMHTSMYSELCACVCLQHFFGGNNGTTFQTKSHKERQQIKHKNQTVWVEEKAGKLPSQSMFP